ncbi:MAG: polysaccharide deacetylase [Pseudozobellia sp.]|nr:polysaccharide deacetylase [Pseudozobellia sp.]MBG48641.1 polysaccharide deacetylase [Pseudozobellia sp.]|tara:strand:+ start:446471 stop:447262 length:792 start_codon:yes stop_codon:yes gene_type:complete
MSKSVFLSTLLFLIGLCCYSQIIKKPLPEKTVVLTFDDAPASQYSEVAPLLKKFKLGATFYVCEFPPNYADSTLYMTWSQIKQLDDMGFEIGNHTHTHANVAKTDPKQFNQELGYIERKCDSLGIPLPDNFAYPGYGLNKKALHLLSDRKYKMARAGGSRAYNPTIDHPYLIPSWAPDSENETEIWKAIKSAEKGKIIVLTFHGVPDIEHPWVSVPVNLFEKYLNYLSENDYTVLSMRDLKEYIDFDNALKTIDPDFTLDLRN